MTERTATLTVDHQSIKLPIREGTLGSPVIDLANLKELKEEIFTYDPGFMSSASCESAITYIDGKKGLLLHRGYPIEQLAAKRSFMDVCYLLLNGELPTPDQRATFDDKIKSHMVVHEQICNFFNGFRRDAHPMAIMVGVVGALSAFYHDALDIKNPEHRELAALRLIAKMPTIAAMSHQYAMGHRFMSPQKTLSYSENFLNMMFNSPFETKPIDPVLSCAMDRIFILHADHEQNASTSTVRMAGSTGANPFACISAGIGALWGPAHGGANEACLNMLREIGHESKISHYIQRAKDKHDTFRLMGFGHRVYKTFDPRAKIMKETCHEVLKATKSSELPLFKLAIQLEKIALEDEYFIEHNLYPNVDFYSGLTLSALGFSSSMFTVIFALARTAGWIAQWNEMITNGYKLSRPRQLYVGPKQRNVS